MTTGGLLTITEVAGYLRVRPDDVLRMVEEDGLPVIELPGKTRPLKKFSAMALHKWLVRHSKGEPVGLDDFLREIEAVRTGSTEGRAA